MHYCVLAMIPKGTPRIEGHVLDAVAKLMAPSENDHWDWWQVGGRWQGLISGYDPAKEPANWRTCDICGGTGERRDAVAMANGFRPGYCNGCTVDHEKYGLPIGKRVVWPTDLKFHAGDVATVDEVLRSGKLFFAIVTPDGKWHEPDEDWEHYPHGNQKAEEKWEKRRAAQVKRFRGQVFPRLLKKHRNCLVVVVDCHN